MVLDQGPTPLYYQLKNILKSKILSNKPKANRRLPSETELCMEYNVSRVTVRQALSELMKDGLIYRDRGKGTFVTDGAGLRHLSLRGTIENLIASGEGSRMKILDSSKTAPPPTRSNFLLAEPEARIPPTDQGGNASQEVRARNLRGGYAGRIRTFRLW